MRDIALLKTFLRDTRGLIEKCNVKLYELFAVLFVLSRITCIIRIEASAGEKHDTQIRDIKQISHAAHMYIGLTLRKQRDSFAAI